MLRGFENYIGYYSIKIMKQFLINLKYPTLEEILDVFRSYKCQNLLQITEKVHHRKGDWSVIQQKLLLPKLREQTKEKN